MAKQDLRVSDRDWAVLRLLDRTPATTALILQASVTFPNGPFRDRRRVRERLQRLGQSGLVRRWSLSLSAGGAANYYKLGRGGYRLLYGANSSLPHNRFFAAIPVVRLQHTLTLAEVIVHTLVSAHRHRIAITRFYRENALTLSTGAFQQQPDCMLQLSTGGRRFNALFEIDRSTEPVDANSHRSIRRKILGYEAYQDHVWATWKANGRKGARPAFRVAFLTRTIDRAYHILTLARDLAHNKDRRLCYGATQDSYLVEADALRQPLFLDHHGHWQALVNLHPTAPFPKMPVRLPASVALHAVF